MKMINGKGKLLGIINPIDLTIILIFILAIGAGAYFLMSRNESEQPTVAAEDVYIKVQIKGILKNTADNIKVDEIAQFVDTPKTLGKITEKEVTPALQEFITKEGEITYVEVPDRVDVMLTLEGKAQITVDGYFFNGVKTFINNTKYIETDRVGSLQCTVIDMNRKAGE